MNRFIAIGVLTVGAAFVVACAPAVAVQNKTRIAVRVVITSGGHSEVLSPSPGESSVAEVTEGPYRAYAIPDQEWIDYAKATRQYLNDRLANSENLTGPQLLDVIQRLKDIAARMAEFEHAGGGTGCAGSVSSDQGGSVEVSIAADGSLTVACK